MSILFLTVFINSISFKSFSGFIFENSCNRFFKTSLSKFNSLFHPMIFISFKFIFTFFPIWKSLLIASSISSSSSNSISSTSSNSALLPYFSNLLISFMVLSINPTIFVKVILNESTELSNLFNKLTLINICKLLSLSACFNFAFPSFTFVSYISSYFSLHPGKIKSNGLYTHMLSWERSLYTSSIEIKLSILVISVDLLIGFNLVGNLPILFIS